MDSWHWNRDEGLRSLRPEEKGEEKPWDIVEELTNDPRIGKRVFCLSLLPEFEVYGTIEGITRYSRTNELRSRAMEYWRVITDPGMGMESPSTYFELYEEKTELKAGDRVRHNIDEGGYWEGVILRAVAAIGQLRFLIKIENVQTRRGKKESGSEEAHPPSRLLKI